MTRPSGEIYLKSELQNIKRAEANILVSLLEDTELEKMELQNEGQYASDMGLKFIHFPIPDRDIPKDSEKAIELVKLMAKALKDGSNVIVHCRKSIGRSPMIAAAVMTWLGLSPKKAFQHIKKIRRAQVPDQASQLRWVEEVAKISPVQKKNSTKSLFERMFSGDA
ncbi:MAG: hypothetical protein MRZ79_27615 [Bacteroidia bacterium]|nr:hypothetical protein [Bacteroidia bacterium]